VGQQAELRHTLFVSFVEVVVTHSMTSPNLSWRLTALCVVGLACTTATGCGSQKKSLARQQSGLKKLAIVYGRFLSQHRGKPPANLTSFGIDDSNRVFISNRDNKPYVIIYGQPKGPPGPGGSPVIAYEQQGEAGMRWVASALGAVEEVDEARFRQLVPTAKQ